VFTERNQDDRERYEELRKWLATDEYLLPTRQLTQCYFDWIASNRTVWPFEGGRLQQPDWVERVFKTLERLEEFHKLKKKVITTFTLPMFNPKDM